MARAQRSKGENLLTRAEVADRLGVAYPTVAQWQKKKWLPSVKRGREVMIPESALTEFEAERKTKRRKTALARTEMMVIISEHDLAEIEATISKLRKSAGRVRYNAATG